MSTNASQADANPEGRENVTSLGVRDGIRAFGLRQVFSELFGLVFSVLIARILTPYDFGVFAICGATLTLLGLAGNAGLAAPIIRSAEYPKARLLQTLFAVYMLLAITIFCVIWWIAPLLPLMYAEIQPQHAWLVRLMATGIIIHTFGGVSYALLERELRFREIANVEFIETIAYSSLTLILAGLGFGVWSLAIAGLSRPTVSSILYWKMRPWPIRIAFDDSEFSKVCHISLAIQGSAITGSLREQLFPVVVGSVCGPTALGFLTWARSSAAKPLSLSYAFDRIALPWYARTHRESGNIRPAVLLSITMLASLLYPLTGLMLAVAEPAIRHLYGTQWLPAVPAFNILCLTVLTAPFRGPLQSVIDAQAKAPVLVRCAMVAVFVQWVVGIGGTLIWGYVGAALAIPAYHVAICAYCYQQTRKQLDFNPFGLLLRPSIHGLIVGIATHTLCSSLSQSLSGFCLAVSFGVLLMVILAPTVQPVQTAKWVGFIRETASRSRQPATLPAAAE